MKDKISGFHEAERQRAAGQHEDVRQLLAPTVRWIAAQHRAVLRQALGRDGAEVMAKVEAATVDLEATVARSVEARLQELMRDEVRSLFEHALSCIESLPACAIVNGAQSLAGREDSDTKISASANADAVVTPSGSPAWEDEEDSEESSTCADDELYEGNVTLILEASGGVGQILQFVRELSREPEVRLLKLASKADTGVDISLALRQPLYLKKILPNIKGVSQVSQSLERSSAGKDRKLTVQLADATHPLANNFA